MALKSTTEETVQTHRPNPQVSSPVLPRPHSQPQRKPRTQNGHLCFHNRTGNIPLNPELSCRKAWDVSTETTLHALQHGTHSSEAPLAGRDGTCLFQQKQVYIWELESSHSYTVKPVSETYTDTPLSVKWANSSIAHRKSEAAHENARAGVLDSSLSTQGNPT